MHAFLNGGREEGREGGKARSEQEEMRE